MELEATYLYKLHRLTTSLDHLFGAVLRKHAGVSLTQLLILMSVKRHKNQYQIARFLGYSRVAIKQQVATAVQRGWLELKNDPQNQRHRVVSLTPLGEEVIQVGTQALERYAFKIFIAENRQMGLMQHLDALLTQIKESDSHITNSTTLKPVISKE